MCARRPLSVNGSPFRDSNGVPRPSGATDPAKSDGHLGKANHALQELLSSPGSPHRRDAALGVWPGARSATAADCNSCSR